MPKIAKRGLGRSGESQVRPPKKKDSSPRRIDEPQRGGEGRSLTPTPMRDQVSPNPDIRLTRSQTRKDREPDQLKDSQERSEQMDK